MKTTLKRLNNICIPNRARTVLGTIIKTLRPSLNTVTPVKDCIILLEFIVSAFSMVSVILDRNIAAIMKAITRARNQ